MSAYTDAISNHYERPRLGTTILRALQDAGKDLDRLTRDDIAAVGEFHIRGREATRLLAELANLRTGDHVLDVGCGIGGPARTLAAEFGCRVTGLDLTKEYCRTAELLTEHIDLSDQVTFHHGNALNMPFADASFDVVWTQHTLMNVEDKPRLFREARRVLRPDGRLALYEICAGSGGPPHFPVPWADNASINFLASPERMEQMIIDAGFTPRVWNDVTKPSLAWFREVAEAMANRPPEAPPPLGLNLLMGASTSDKIDNVIRNLEEDRIVVVEGVLDMAE